MSLKVEVRPVGSATVVRFHGVGCLELLAMLAEDLDRSLAASDLLIVDLDDATLTDAGHLARFVEAITAMAPEVRFVCRRVVGRRLLRRACGSMRAPLFASVEEALALPMPDALGGRRSVFPGPAA